MDEGIPLSREPQALEASSRQGRRIGLLQCLLQDAAVAATAAITTVLPTGLRVDEGIPMPRQPQALAANSRQGRRIGLLQCLLQDAATFIPATSSFCTAALVTTIRSSSSGSSGSSAVAAALLASLFVRDRGANRAPLQRDVLGPRVQRPSRALGWALRHVVQPRGQRAHVQPRPPSSLDLHPLDARLVGQRLG